MATYVLHNCLGDLHDSLSHLVWFWWAGNFLLIIYAVPLETILITLISCRCFGFKALMLLECLSCRNTVDVWYIIWHRSACSFVFKCSKTSIGWSFAGKLSTEIYVYLLQHIDWSSICIMLGDPKAMSSMVLTKCLVYRWWSAEKMIDRCIAVGILDFSCYQDCSVFTVQLSEYSWTWRLRFT